MIFGENLKYSKQTRLFDIGCWFCSLKLFLMSIPEENSTLPTLNWGGNLKLESEILVATSSLASSFFWGILRGWWWQLRAPTNWSVAQGSKEPMRRKELQQSSGLLMGRFKLRQASSIAWLSSGSCKGASLTKTCHRQFISVHVGHTVLYLLITATKSTPLCRPVGYSVVTLETKASMSSFLCSVKQNCLHGKTGSRPDSWLDYDKKNIYNIIYYQMILNGYKCNEWYCFIHIRHNRVTSIPCFFCNIPEFLEVPDRFLTPIHFLLGVHLAPWGT